MTDLTTTHLQRLLWQSTPGPWEYDPGNAPDGRCIIDAELWNMCIAVEANSEGSSCSDAELELAAHAPELAQEVIRTWQQRHKNVMDDNPDWAAQNLAHDLHNAGLLAAADYSEEA